MRQTYREYNDVFVFAFHDDAEVVADFETAEGFVDKDVADLRRGDEARGRGEEVGRWEGGGLDAEGAEGEDGFFCWVGEWGVSVGLEDEVEKGKIGEVLD